MLVIVIYYLKNRQEVNKLVKIGMGIKIPNTEGNFIIYNINKISCVSLANKSLQGFD